MRQTALDGRPLLSTFKNKTMHVGDFVLDYIVTYNDGQYDFEIKVRDDSKRCFSARDVARDKETAEYLLELFSSNLVFPENAPEIFDDLLCV